jgi:hypothetical protein
MYKIEVDFVEYHFDTLEEAKQVAGRIYEVTGDIVGIEKVEEDQDEQIQDGI